MGIFSRIAVDTRALRESRDFRLLTAGTIITGIGAQTALLTGMPGLAELIPRATETKPLRCPTKNQSQPSLNSRTFVPFRCFCIGCTWRGQT